MLESHVARIVIMVENQRGEAADSIFTHTTGAPRSKDVSLYWRSSRTGKAIDVVAASTNRASTFMANAPDIIQDQRHVVQNVEGLSFPVVGS